MDKNGKTVIAPVSLAFAGLLALWFFLSIVLRKNSYSYYDASVAVAFAALALIASFVVVIFSRRYGVGSVVNTAFTLAYPGMFFALLYLMIVYELGMSEPYYGTMSMILMVFLPAMLSDTFAYFFGSAFGKKKLCPHISPKKTIVGSIAGIAGGMVAGLLIFFVLRLVAHAGGKLIFIPGLLSFVWKGAVLAAISQVGDLSASLIKRSLGVKDFGKLLPGHGGVVDRMDSIMFCIPVLYLFDYILYW